MITILLSGFALGFAGSLHCIGMCGPLSLALPTAQLSKWGKFFSLLLYQSGRIITYSSIGLIIGLAGKGLFIAGLQQWLSITLGIFVLMLATLYFLKGNAGSISFFGRFYAGVANLISSIMKRYQGVAGFLLLGMANGLLPCGMVYIALAAALSFHSIFQSVGFMALFGAGTLPAMMLVGYSKTIFSRPLARIFKKSIPYFIGLTGLLLIMRGLNMGIPFISPKIPDGISEAIGCHPN